MKRLLIILMLFALTISANAQIFLTEDDYNSRTVSSELGFDVPAIPQLDSTDDQYSPVGDGILLLGVLGGAYLLGKRKRGKE